MILPWLRGFKTWHEVPLTWCLIALNFVFFILTNQTQTLNENLSVQDLKFAARSYSLMKQIDLPTDESEILLRGAQAVRDQNFFDQFMRFAPTRDQIALEAWQKKLFEFQSDLQKRPVDIFGLHGQEKHPMSWITYQFMHSGAWHLFGNMMLLLVFSSAVELMAGSFLTVFIYLIGGFAGAAFYVGLHPDSSAPMVGASASLSAVMGFYVLFEQRKRIRFFYFLAPNEGYWGEVFLPTFVIVPLFFVDDLAQLISTSKEFGGAVAHSAHVGGALFGLLFAFLLRKILIKYPQAEQILGASYSRSRPVVP